MVRNQPINTTPRSSMLKLELAPSFLRNSLPLSPSIYSSTQISNHFLADQVTENTFDITTPSNYDNQIPRFAIRIISPFTKPLTMCYFETRQYFCCNSITAGMMYCRQAVLSRRVKPNPKQPLIFSTKRCKICEQATCRDPSKPLQEPDKLSVRSWNHCMLKDVLDNQYEWTCNRRGCEAITRGQGVCAGCTVVLDFYCTRRRISRLRFLLHSCFAQHFGEDHD